MTASEPIPPRLYLIRHGETEWSLSGQHTGLTDIPLTPHGERAAQEVGRRLRTIHFAHVFTSPLRRAQQVEPDLAEWNYGDYEGRTSADISNSRPGWNLFHLRRLGLVMEPEPGNPKEIEGVLNPAVVRGRDGELYLLPRLVAKGNYSRIGIARVRFNDAGDWQGVERLGIALEPEADYERRGGGGGGCEDPRSTFVEPIQRYVMTYTAFSPEGPRIAVALSEDLFRRRRTGLASFGSYQEIEFAGTDDKDAGLFSVAIPNRSGHPELVMLYRPPFPGTRPDTASHPVSCEVDLDRRKHLDFILRHAVGWPRSSNSWQVCLSSPAGDSGGTLGAAQNRRHHSAGSHPAWLADHLPRLKRSLTDECCRARVVLLRRGDGAFEKTSARGPLSFAEAYIETEGRQERSGTVANVVFPTGIDRRDDLGSPHRFDVYGTADSRIGVARLDLPEFLPSGRAADPPEARV